MLPNFVCANVAVVKVNGACAPRCIKDTEEALEVALFPGKGPGPIPKIDADPDPDPESMGLRLPLWVRELEKAESGNEPT